MNGSEIAGEGLRERAWTMTVVCLLIWLLYRLRHPFGYITHDMRAAVQALEEKARGAGGDKWELAHHRAISAPGAWTWKAVRPEGPQLRLSDVEYTLAARMNLGLQPLPPLARTMLPPDCPLCKRRVSLDTDPWHWLSCKFTNVELSRRHDAVVDAISRVARQVGAQVRTEVKGLDPHSEKRPDLMLVFPGRMLLTDVAVSHTLTPSAVTECVSVVKQRCDSLSYLTMELLCGTCFGLVC